MAHILEVPLATDGEVLTVDLEEDLPEDPSEICVLLENEKCAPKYWLAFAAAYARAGGAAAAAEVVQRGLASPAAAEGDAQFLTFAAWLKLGEFRRAAAVDKPTVYAQAVDAANRATAASGEASGGSVAALLVRGTLTQAAGNFDDAHAPFQAVLKREPANIWALLGRAGMLYHRKNYRAALKLYQNVLQRRPKLVTPDPRLGIGLCYQRLGDLGRATTAFRRSLALRETAEAHSMLGTLLLDVVLHDSRADSFAVAYTEAMSHLARAWTLNRQPLAAVGLASYYFSKRDLVKVRALASAALEVSSFAPARQEALMWLGRAAHYDGDNTTALELYSQAGATHLVALLGKALVEERMGMTGEALTTLDTLIAASPRNHGGLFYSGALRARTATSGHAVDAAVAALDKYVSQGGPLPEARILLASLLDKRDPTRALSYLRTVLETLEAAPNTEGSAEVSKLQINRSALAFAAGLFDEALDALEAAKTADPLKYAPTIAYNTARVQEAQGKLDAAAEAYAKLDTRDARARHVFLKSIRQFGDGESAQTITDELLALLTEAPRDLELRALVGWQLRRLRSGQRADEREMEHWKTTLVDVDKHDAYALVSLGNVYLFNARETRVTRDADAERRERAYARAAEFFDKALQIDSRNAYAAQGLGIVLAETGLAAEALGVFGRVRETLEGDAAVAVNTGHALMQLKQYTRAAELYELALARLPTEGADAEASGVLSLLGRAWYARGASARDPVALEKAVEYASAAASRGPNAPALRFNVAFVQFQLADVVRRLPASKRSLELVSKAQAGLESAVVALRELATLERPPYPAKDLEERAELAEATITDQLARAAEEQEAHQQAASQKLAEARDRLAQEQEARELEHKRKREEIERREQELAEERRRLQDQAREWEAEQRAEREREAEQQPERKRAKTSRGKTNGASGDDFIDDNVLDASPSPPASPPDSPEASPAAESDDGNADLGEDGAESKAEEARKGSKQQKKPSRLRKKKFDGKEEGEKESQDTQEAQTDPQNDVREDARDENIKENGSAPDSTAPGDGEQPVPRRTNAVDDEDDDDLF